MTIKAELPPLPPIRKIEADCSAQKQSLLDFVEMHLKHSARFARPETSLQGHVDTAQPPEKVDLPSAHEIVAHNLLEYIARFSEQGYQKTESHELIIATNNEKSPAEIRCFMFEPESDQFPTIGTWKSKTIVQGLRASKKLQANNNSLQDRVLWVCRFPRSTDDQTNSLGTFFVELSRLNDRASVVINGFSAISNSLERDVEDYLYLSKQAACENPFPHHSQIFFLTKYTPLQLPTEKLASATRFLLNNL